MICSLKVDIYCGLIQARQKDLVMPVYKVEGGEGYVGATVTEPQRGKVGQCGDILFSRNVH